MLSSIIVCILDVVIDERIILWTVVVQNRVCWRAFEFRNGIFRPVEVLGQLSERKSLMLLFVFTSVL